jgi:hypothetical protein
MACQNHNVMLYNMGVPRRSASADSWTLRKDGGLIEALRYNPERESRPRKLVFIFSRVTL